VNIKSSRHFAVVQFFIVCLIATLPFTPNAIADDVEVLGFVENATFVRGHSIGVTKSRSTFQYEIAKAWQSSGFFSDVSLNATFRGSFDAVYNLNADEFGRSSGSSLSYPAPGNPAFFGILATGNPNTPPFPPSTNPEYAGVFPPPVPTGAIPLPGVPFGNIGANNPNAGLAFLGSDVHNFERGGVVLAYPTRPCDIDNRGCIAGYMDDDEDDLRFPEFGGDADFIRELYIDATHEMDDGKEFGIRFGRQQIVWAELTFSESLMSSTRSIFPDIIYMTSLKISGFQWVFSTWNTALAPRVGLKT